MIDLNFEIPVKKDIPQLKKLWADVFCEDKRAVSLIFDSYFDIFNAYCAKQKDAIVAALYLIDGSINGQKAHYLCGAATLPDYRRQGIMSRLIEYALMNAKAEGDRLSLLFPANDSLYDYYRGLGYSACYCIRSVELSRKQLEAFDLSAAKACNKSDYEQLQKNSFGKDFFLQSNRFFDFSVEYYRTYGIKVIRGSSCFAFVEEKNGCAEVFYCAYSDYEELKRLLLKNTVLDNFKFTLKADKPRLYGTYDERFGMIRPLDDNAVKAAYTGITLV